jgi:hypothetical protein
MCPDTLVDGFIGLIQPRRLGVGGIGSRRLRGKLCADKPDSRAVRALRRER